MIIGSRRPAAVEPKASGSDRVSVVPVLPPVGQVGYPPYQGASSALRVTYAGEPVRPDRPAASTAGSFGDRQLHDPTALVLARKQFGNAIWTSPLAEVQSKVDRVYLDRRPAARSGYLEDGTSPYWPTYQRALGRLPAVESDVVLWDRPRRRLMLDSGAWLRYQRAIVTLPLKHLVDREQLDVSLPLMGPAVFMVMQTSGHSAQRLIYDLDPRSPVFRVLTPTPTSAVVQLSLVDEADSKYASGDVLGAVEALVDAEIRAVTVEEHRQELAYPLEPLGPRTRDLFAAMRENEGVTFFGRYAAHRYVDLHELPWDELRTWLK